MDNRMIWKPEDYPTSIGDQTWAMLRDVTLDHRLEALREIALTLLHEVESLRTVEATHHGDDPRLPEAVRRFESQLILAALEKTGGNQFRAARMLGVKHTTLNAKIKRYGISINGNRSGNQFSDQEIAA